MENETKAYPRVQPVVQTSDSKANASALFVESVKSPMVLLITPTFPLRRPVRHRLGCGEWDKHFWNAEVCTSISTPNMFVIGQSKVSISYFPEGQKVRSVYVLDDRKVFPSARLSWLRSQRIKIPTGPLVSLQ